MSNQAGVLMLCTGPTVSEVPGTWVKYQTALSGGFVELKPTYGTWDDVQNWLVELNISAEHIVTFNEQVRLGAKPSMYMFDIQTQ